MSDATNAVSVTPPAVDIGKAGRRALRWLEFPVALAVVVGLWQAVSVIVGNSTMVPAPARVVRAQVEHRFHEISEELELLVFFAPAEGAPSR